jgi:hypothetical protein
LSKGPDFQGRRLVVAFSLALDDAEQLGVDSQIDDIG